ncbi:DUF4193 domain-containing protein [Mycobacterium botniense]|uniref:dUTPase n=1 Tax=Mycobacterium botniense TaxID=84962 RepID=A0A7I9Y3G1_9MYCO|nr:DUF4193 domain-containing protein [Mycobacterium botniense]GFG76612.1 hypothetical protein MBOT_39770 [Mycobacterium botniense]
MATDYDTPRHSDIDEEPPFPLDELKTRHSEIGLDIADEDELEAGEPFELPEADLSGEELSVRIIPKRADEFTCSSCFLVHHRSRLARQEGGRMICADCAT